LLMRNPDGWSTRIRPSRAGLVRGVTGVEPAVVGELSGSPAGGVDLRVPTSATRLSSLTTREEGSVPRLLICGVSCVRNGDPRWRAAFRHIQVRVVKKVGVRGTP